MEKVFRKAAKSALFSWKQNIDGIDDLVNDLWVWYLERPGTQRKLQGSDYDLAVDLVRVAALQMLKEQSLSADLFDGKNIYSSDSVREALRGESSNHYLYDIMPMAMRELDKQNEGHAEAIRIRYEDGIVPGRDSSEKYVLIRAVKSLTEIINIIAITAGMRRDDKGKLVTKEGPGSRNAIFPETRKSQGGGHSDPTGNTAIMLIENPELHDEYLRETPWDEFLGTDEHAQSA